ncbi:MAG TPA: DUF2169 domain-containing protein [Sandaracinaceae bacterium LLY-WYZ-13_1]|nr:DUF2169 domain-containing protein [Sandaracinaceae bacterium LLY-WYZ-13_1]
MLTRPFQWGRDHHLGVSVLGFFPFDPPNQLLTDMELWTAVPEVLGQDAMIDAGIPKARSEVLVSGSAHQPGGRMGPTLPVRVEIGGIDKQLYVIGDRRWERGVPTEPLPFAQMPLSWERAFGGEGFDPNPRGRGYAPIEDAEGRTVHPLPNVENPDRLVRSPKDRPEPAGFGAIDFTWPQRFKLAGTYDKKWLETRFPGFAEDLDWRIWNLAAPDQQREAPFRGDEHFRLHNLHPEHPLLEGRLPGVQTRCFVNRRVQEDDEVLRFIEVEMRLTTVWLLPGILRGLLVFQGATPIREDDAADVEHILVAGEWIGQPRAAQHYHAVLEKRLNPENVVETLNDADLMPEELTGLGGEIERQTELTSPQGLQIERKHAAAAKKIEETRAGLIELGLDPDEHGPTELGPIEKPPPMSELPEFIEKLKQTMEAERAKQEEAMKERIARVEQLYEELGLDAEELRGEIEGTQRGPFVVTAESERARFRKMADDAAARGEPVDELEHYATDPEIYASWEKQEEMLRQAYLSVAHHQEPAFAMEPADSERVRAEVEDRVRRRESLARIDLTGADLSRLDLEGADFTEAFLEATNLEEANLTGARFDRAVLAHANLTSAKLRDTSFAGANLGKARMVAVVAEGAVDFEGATLWQTDLSAAVLRGASLPRVLFYETKLDQADFSSAALTQAAFHEASFDRTRFGGADLFQASFLESRLVDVDFGGARLEEAVFLKCVAVGAKLVNANMANFRVVLECDLSEADAKGANLDRSCLRDTKLQRADLSGARLNKADMSGADLTEARLYRIVARDSLWIRTKLRRAQMVSADLFQAFMSKADVRGADLRGANLYGADFSLVRSDRDTKVQDAIQLKVRTLPMREKP